MDAVNPLLALRDVALKYLRNRDVTTLLAKYKYINLLVYF